MVMLVFKNIKYFCVMNKQVYFPKMDTRNMKHHEFALFYMKNTFGVQ